MFRPWITALVVWTLLVGIPAGAKPPKPKDPNLQEVLDTPDRQFQDTVERLLKSGWAERLSLEDSFRLLDGCFWLFSPSGVDEDLTREQYNRRLKDWDLTTEKLGEIAWRKADKAGLRVMQAMVERSDSEQLNNGARYWIALKKLELAIQSASAAKRKLQWPEGEKLSKKLKEDLPLEDISNVEVFVRLTHPYLAKNPSVFTGGDPSRGGSLNATGVTLADGMSAGIKTYEEIQKKEAGRPPFSHHSMKLWFEEIATLTALLQAKESQEAVGFALLTDFSSCGFDRENRPNRLVFSLLKLLAPEWEKAVLGRELFDLRLQEKKAGFSIPGAGQPWEKFASSPQVIRESLRLFEKAQTLNFRSFGLEDFLDIEGSPGWKAHIVRFREAPLPAGLRKEVSATLAKDYLQTIESLAKSPDDEDWTIPYAIHIHDVAALITTPEMDEVLRKLANFPAKRVREMAAATLKKRGSGK